MTDERSPIRIHVLHCGSMLVSKAVPYGGGVNLKNARRGVFDKVADRVELRFRPISSSTQKARCSSTRAGAAI